MSIEANLELALEQFRLQMRFSVPGVGITGVFGPSASGKTSLLRIIAGLEPDATGSLTVNGRSWQDGRKRLHTHRRPMSFVMQDATLFSHLTVRKNLEYGYQRTPKERRHIGFGEAVSLLGLDGLLHRSTSRLSGGETKRVAIARAILTSPRLLLMDEPLAGLDRKSRDEVLPFIACVQHDLDMPMLYVSHETDELATLADHMILIERGKVRATGLISDLLTRTDLELAHRDDAETLFIAKVTGHQHDYHLALLDIGGHQFSVAHHQKLAKGTQVRLRILARDVSLSLDRPENTSILNILPVEIEHIRNEPHGQALISLNIAEQRLLSRITQKSVDSLALHPGLKAFAQVKSVALLV